MPFFLNFVFHVNADKSQRVIVIHEQLTPRLEIRPRSLTAAGSPLLANQGFVKVIVSDRLQFRLNTLAGEVVVQAGNIC